MIHKGEVIEKVVRASGMSISKVAEKMGKSRRWMYLIYRLYFQYSPFFATLVWTIFKLYRHLQFENPNVSTDVIIELSKVLHHPFHELLQTSELAEPKYYALLEEHLEMLKKMGSL